MVTLVEPLSRQSDAGPRHDGDGDGAARRKLAFLGEVSAHLARGADEAELLAGIAALGVPVLGDWVGIFVAGEDGRLALAVQAGSRAIGDPLLCRLRGDPERPLARAAAGAEPFLIRPAASGPTGIAAPIRLERRPIGVLVAARAEGACGSDELSLAKDVAQRTALAVAHARLVRDATIAAASREEFLHVASHELRGPVGTLRLTVQLLARDAGKGDSAALESRLRILDRQSTRLVRLSDALLDVSRLSVGRLDLAREEGDLAALVREIAAGFLVDAKDAGVALSIDADAPVRCTFDPARMEQVVSNLLSNAVKYGRGAPVRVSVRGAEGGVRIEVEDHGIGVAPEEQERIFGRFERAVSGRHYGGLGLGLWISRRLVEAHGGTIGVRSAPGAGATFTVVLPS
jgi:signal transduction histidine kinase